MYQYQVSFGEAVKRAFSQYCKFTGRASRSEYWWFFLFLSIINIIFSGGSSFFTVKGVFDGTITSEISALLNPFVIASGIWGLIILLPTWGLLFRRLHDTGRSGWNCLWGLLPFIGSIILIVYCCQESQPGENKYGPMPNLTEGNCSAIAKQA